MQNNHLVRFLYLCGIAAPPTIILIIIIASAITPGYNPLMHNISTLCDQNSLSPGLMMSGFISFGCLMMLFSLGLFLGLGRNLESALIAVFFTLYGAGLIFTGLFRDSPNLVDIPINAEGIVHNVSTTTAFFSLLAGMLLFSRHVHGREHWHGLTWVTIVAAAIGLLSSIIFIVSSHVTYSGIIQRLFFMIPMIWIEAVSIWLFQLTFPSHKKEAETILE